MIFCRARQSEHFSVIHDPFTNHSTELFVRIQRQLQNSVSMSPHSMSITYNVIELKKSKSHNYGPTKSQGGMILKKLCSAIC